MGLMQKAVETYECHQSYIGQYEAGHTVLAPVSHIVTRANVEIVLNADGGFLEASAVPKDDPKIIIPATESSAGRTANVCAHPLCDQLGYLAPYNEEKHADYVAQLEAWEQSPYSHPKLPPILAYIRKGTILNDLAASELLRLDAQGRLEDEKKEGKWLVRWRVTGLADGAPDACWQDPTLFDSFIRFYQATKKGDPADLCMVTGKIARRASQHPKGVIPTSGNAKLVSSNDETGFTFRGRFTSEEQAATVSYEASQKAHNALRWLAAEQGAQAVFGGRTFLCWNPQGHEVRHVVGPFARQAKPVHRATDYQELLKKTLEGCKSKLPEAAGVVIAVFDAATSGRLSLTYYQEMKGSDFLQRLYEWDKTCCWPTRYYGIQAPWLIQIVHCAFGTQQTEKGKKRMKADDRVLRQHMQRLVACRVEKSAFPADIMRALFHRASFPLAYDPAVREDILSTACAVIRKYRYDRYKEEWNMMLDPKKKDLSYQFGRLLAVLEKAERDTYEDKETREPNAIRQQAMFNRRPMYTAKMIESQLESAYFPRLSPGGRFFYKKLIGEIMEQIAQFPEEQWNRPLRETYLMGYYLQRNALYTSRHNQEMEEQNHDETAE